MTHEPASHSAPVAACWPPWMDLGRGGHSHEAKQSVHQHVVAAVAQEAALGHSPPDAPPAGRAHSPACFLLLLQQMGDHPVLPLGGHSRGRCAPN